MLPSNRGQLAYWNGPMGHLWAHVHAKRDRDHAPGRYAFANPDRVKSILLRAGFHAPEFRKFDAPILLGATTEEAASSSIDAGPLARILAEVDDETSKKVRDAVTARPAREMGPTGIYLAAGCWLITAKA